MTGNWGPFPLRDLRPDVTERRIICGKAHIVIASAGIFKTNGTDHWRLRSIWASCDLSGRVGFAPVGFEPRDRVITRRAPSAAPPPIAESSHASGNYLSPVERRSQTRPQSAAVQHVPGGRPSGRRGGTASAHQRTRDRRGHCGRTGRRGSLPRGIWSQGCARPKGQARRQQGSSPFRQGGPASGFPQGDEGLEPASRRAGRPGRWLQTCHAAPPPLA